MRADDSTSEWTSVIVKTSIYRPIQPVANPVLHNIVTCDLRAAEFTSNGSAVLGPYSRAFYVSENAVYVWVSQPDYYVYSANGTREPATGVPNAVVYRLPLDDSKPGALRAMGSPVDQFSFKEGSDGYLNVLVRAGSNGDAMWSAEITSGQVGVVRITLKNFTARANAIVASTYTTLPTPKGYNLQNRFVGDYLLYGAANAGWYNDPAAENMLFVKAYKNAQETTPIALGHGVDRIEVMGSDAVVVGNARPIFWKDRIFALLGYELVEGTLPSADAIQESGRKNMLTLPR